MTCSICYEPYLRATPKGMPVRGFSDSAADTAQRPAALSCGHTFHKECIEGWFENSGIQRCTQCLAVHTGQITVLYIDIDEEDYEASRKDDGQSSTRSGSYSRRGNAAVRQLTCDIGTKDYVEDGRNHHVMRELARLNQELETANMHLKDDLERTRRAMANEATAMDAEMDELAIELDVQRRLYTETKILLAESFESLQREKERTARLESKIESLQALVHHLRDKN